MFGIFASERKRARHDARNWLHLANKVCHFRRDQLPEKELKDLRLASNELKGLLREQADAGKLKIGMQKLEGCLRQSGGAYYPKSTMIDNVEFFLVALILFLGVREFFIQPFKIPTNSMYPSYYGMTVDFFSEPDEEPGFAHEWFRRLAYGASPRRLDAPANGEVKLAVYVAESDRSILFGKPVPMRRWLIIPAPGMEHALVVGNSRVTFRTPQDFRFSHVLENAFFAGRMNDFQRALSNARPSGNTMVASQNGRSKRFLELLVDTGVTVREGERILAFDILTGDQLFVDRLSYHFVRPKPGDGFVFRTNHIRGIEVANRYTDKFYIKRLVGVPGDTLEVRPPVLYRNGKPIEGSDAFQKNAQQVDNYPGYEAVRRLAPGQTVTVPEHFYFAMGDNSSDSADGRMWGFVPEADVMGRPLWIYFPFTRRWGPAP